MTGAATAWVRAAIGGAAAAAVGLAQVWATAPPPRLLVNETPSAPRGLYVRSAALPAPGRLVAVAQPSAARGYLRGLGVPPGLPLLKRIAAVGGARVCATHDRMVWVGGSAAILARDRRKVPLPHWSGCRRLAADELLLVGDTPTSFDSRYFGAVRRVAVLGVYRRVWSW